MAGRIDLKSSAGQCHRLYLILRVYVAIFIVIVTRWEKCALILPGKYLKMQIQTLTGPDRSSRIATVRD